MRAIVGVVGFIGFVVAAFVLTLVPGGVWSGLLSINLKTGIGTPWAVPAALGLLWLAWQYAGGKWPWQRSQNKAVLRRSNPMSLGTLGWALVANGCALTALTGLWIVLKELVKQPGNLVPDFSVYPLPIIGSVLGCAALVGAVSEEVGLRGYLQTRFERIAPWPLAVVLMALVAAPGHALTQGFVWPTLLFYLLADVTYGVTAYLTNSIIPGVIAHAAGLFIFFAFIWPHDAPRPIVTLQNAEPMFWVSAVQAALFGVFAILAFVRLSKSSAEHRARLQIADIAEIDVIPAM